MTDQAFRLIVFGECSVLICCTLAVLSLCIAWLVALFRESKLHAFAVVALAIASMMVSFALTIWPGFLFTN